ncbi:hypothetical protein BATDEDRAFT_86643 [Batrachochytrium dendrobatidis JAM81]|uniref:Uncharacterized protein n=1 Tax=Batrachochytrium dendrobatidis (strain JAM81 / FGSC 10211) TaxID=684364 RepID=F4NWB7_BATDJ|nr:uncharacterized protein BATDEDRAFT_86643 [Batrachochytrium dendrobatidis JAM81]EGF82451.1 hypothetical protein BATDEDRAFT_86643 [Batrachochytrium dendrobatidis JAM81]|eukprot:XP_006676929.1 hypothetical protein BATDEDRAFT_86643 [Batrachochytrium dendrobatidis JAM81]
MGNPVHVVVEYDPLKSRLTGASIAVQPSGYRPLASALVDTLDWPLRASRTSGNAMSSIPVPEPSSSIDASFSDSMLHLSNSRAFRTITLGSLIARSEVNPNSLVSDSYTYTGFGSYAGQRSSFFHMRQPAFPDEMSENLSQSSSPGIGYRQQSIASDIPQSSLTARNRTASGFSSLSSSPVLERCPMWEHPRRMLLEIQQRELHINQQHPLRRANAVRRSTSEESDTANGQPVLEFLEYPEEYPDEGAENRSFGSGSGSGARTTRIRSNVTVDDLEQLIIRQLRPRTFNLLLGSSATVSRRNRASASPNLSLQEQSNSINESESGQSLSIEGVMERLRRQLRNSSTQQLQNSDDRVHRRRVGTTVVTDRSSALASNQQGNSGRELRNNVYSRGSMREQRLSNSPPASRTSLTSSLTNTGVSTAANNTIDAASLFSSFLPTDMERQSTGTQNSNLGTDSALSQRYRSHPSGTLASRRLFIASTLPNFSSLFSNTLLSAQATSPTVDSSDTQSGGLAANQRNTSANSLSIFPESTRRWSVIERAQNLITSTNALLAATPVSSLGSRSNPSTLDSDSSDQTSTSFRESNRSRLQVPGIQSGSPALTNTILSGVSQVDLFGGLGNQAQINLNLDEHCPVDYEAPTSED